MSPSSAAGGDRCDAAAAASGTTAADGLTVEVRSGRKDWPALIRAPCASEARLGGIDADDARRPGLHMNMRTMSVDVVIGGASPSPACRGVGRSGAPLAATGVGATVGVGGGGKAAAGRAGIEAAGGSGGGGAAARGPPIPAAGSTAGSSGTASGGATPELDAAAAAAAGGGEKGASSSPGGGVGGGRRRSGNLQGAARAPCAIFRGAPSSSGAAPSSHDAVS